MREIPKFIVIFILYCCSLSSVCFASTMEEDVEIFTANTDTVLTLYVGMPVEEIMENFRDVAEWSKPYRGKDGFRSWLYIDKKGFDEKISILIQNNRVVNYNLSIANLSHKDMLRLYEKGIKNYSSYLDSSKYVKDGCWWDKIDEHTYKFWEISFIHPMIQYKPVRKYSDKFTLSIGRGLGLIGNIVR